MKIGKSDASASEREPGRGGSGAPADIGEASCWRGKTTFPAPIIVLLLFKYLLYLSAYTWYMIVYASLDVGGTEESQRPRQGPRHW